MTSPASAAARQSTVVLFLESLSERKIVDKLSSIGTSVSKSAVLTLILPVFCTSRKRNGWRIHLMRLSWIAGSTGFLKVI